METDPDNVKQDSRSEIFLSMGELKELQYPGIDDVAEFLSTTRAHWRDLQLSFLNSLFKLVTSSWIRAVRFFWIEEVTDYNWQVRLLFSFRIWDFDGTDVWEGSIMHILYSETWESVTVRLYTTSQWDRNEDGKSWSSQQIALPRILSCFSFWIWDVPRDRIIGRRHSQAYSLLNPR
jgi:hypothetical protein